MKNRVLWAVEALSCGEWNPLNECAFTSKLGAQRQMEDERVERPQYRYRLVKYEPADR